MMDYSKVWCVTAADSDARQSVSSNGDKWSNVISHDRQSDANAVVRSFHLVSTVLYSMGLHGLTGKRKRTPHIMQ